MRARTLVLLAAALLACSRAQKPESRSEPVATTSKNPFVRAMPPSTARIVYRKRDGSFEEVYQVKNGRVRRETTGGLFANGGYTVSDGEWDVNVAPKRRKVFRLRTDAAHLFEEYQKLGPDAQVAIRRSIALVLPDLGFYQEGTLERLDPRDVHGLHASCYHRTSQILGTTSDECYWLGIKVWMKGKNPIDGGDLDGEATEVVLDPPLDDALFAIPADYEQEVPETDAIMHGVYAKLLDRMQSPRFTIAHLDRYANTP